MIFFQSLVGARKPRSRIAGAWPRALVVALLACLLVQGTAVQSHLHFAGQARVAAPASGGAAVRIGQPASGDAVDCPLCHEAATAGAYLLPPVIVLAAPAAQPVWIAPTALRAFGLATAAHSWLSRAPPQ